MRQQYNVTIDPDLTNDPSHTRSILWLGTAVGSSDTRPSTLHGDHNPSDGATGGPYLLPVAAPLNRFARDRKAHPHLQHPSGRASASCCRTNCARRAWRRLGWRQRRRRLNHASASRCRRMRAAGFSWLRFSAETIGRLRCCRGLCLLPRKQNLVSASPTESFGHSRTRYSTSCWWTRIQRCWF